jgi:hypothetical protein
LPHYQFFTGLEDDNPFLLASLAAPDHQITAGPEQRGAVVRPRTAGNACLLRVYLCSSRPASVGYHEPVKARGMRVPMAGDKGLGAK